MEGHHWALTIISITLSFLFGFIAGNCNSDISVAPTVYRYCLATTKNKKECDECLREPRKKWCLK